MNKEQKTIWIISITFLAVNIVVSIFLNIRQNKMNELAIKISNDTEYFNNELDKFNSEVKKFYKIVNRLPQK